MGVAEAKAHTLHRYLLAEGDVLITRTGSVGRPALVTKEFEGWLYHPNLIRLRLVESDLARVAYLVGYLGARIAQDWLQGRAAGAVIPSVSTRTLGELPVLLPPDEERRAIGATLAALDEKIRAHTEVARATREYRQVLADALLTGVLPPEP